MANFRRNKPRGRTYPRAYSLHFHSWPAWHDLIYHRRPARRRSKALTEKVRRGEVDADNAAWDVHRTRPHCYYW